MKADWVLDIGGGSNPVKGRTRSWEVKEYRILDNKLEEMKQKPDFVADLNKPDCGREITGQWDIVFCLEVAEYLYNPWVAIKNLWGFLKEGGILYISFPFIYPIHSPHRSDYLRYTRFGILKLLDIAGFELIEMIGREAKDPEKLLDFYKSDGMHIKADVTITGYLVKAIKK